MSSMSTSSTMALMSPISQPRVAKVAGISVGAEGWRVESQMDKHKVPLPIMTVNFFTALIISVYYNDIV